MSIANDTQAVETQKAFCDKFFMSGKTPKYVLGLNPYAQELSKLVNIDGFIEDIQDIESFEGLPVFKSKDVPSNALIVTTSLESTKAIRRRLERQKLTNIDYVALSHLMGLKNALGAFYRDFREDYDSHRAEYEAIYAHLFDEESRQTWDAIIRYRLSCDFNELSRFSNPVPYQYFESFLNLSDGEVFVDAGGYHGETTKKFAELCPSYRRVLYFEPEQNNFQVSMRNLSAFERIEFHQMGLYHEQATLGFSSDCGASSHFQDESDVRVEVNALDNLSDDEITYVKMDIEGAEGAALRGAKQVILQHKPKLAICVYHKPDDFRTLGHQVLSYYPNYKIYLRHYTEHHNETVMFFVP